MPSCFASPSWTWHTRPQRVPRRANPRVQTLPSRLRPSRTSRCCSSWPTSATRRATSTPPSLRSLRSIALPSRCARSALASCPKVNEDSAVTLNPPLLIPVPQIRCGQRWWRCLSAPRKGAERRAARCWRRCWAARTSRTRTSSFSAWSRVLTGRLKRWPSARSDVPSGPTMSGRAWRGAARRCRPPPWGARAMRRGDLSWSCWA